MAKIGKMIKFFTICIVVFVVFGYVCRQLFKFVWNFDIFNRESYLILYDYWENGGYLTHLRIAVWGCFCF